MPAIKVVFTTHAKIGRWTAQIMDYAYLSRMLSAMRSR